MPGADLAAREPPTRAQRAGRHLQRAGAHAAVPRRAASSSSSRSACRAAGRRSARRAPTRPGGGRSATASSAPAACSGSASAPGCRARPATRSPPERSRSLTVRVRGGDDAPRRNTSLEVGDGRPDFPVRAPRNSGHPPGSSKRVLTVKETACCQKAPPTPHLRQRDVDAGGVHRARGFLLRGRHDQRQPASRTARSRRRSSSATRSPAQRSASRACARVRRARRRRPPRRPHRRRAQDPLPARHLPDRRRLRRANAAAGHAPTAARSCSALRSARRRGPAGDCPRTANSEPRSRPCRLPPAAS